MTRIFRHYRPKPFVVVVLIMMAMVLPVSRVVAAPLSFAQVNLVTDDKSIYPDAVIQDPSLVNAWGLEIAPASFGAFAGDLLVGNFGDGLINAFDLVTDTLAGQLPAAGGGLLSIEGLWTLTVGNDGNAGSSDKLYFTAGPDDEAHGLFGVLSVPEPGTVWLISALLPLLSWHGRRPRTIAA